ncbi:MAG: hypothetical protein KC419_02550 [Anaerolineales bacterium]|nr:hypothetical protein [Anaerolineales bacterium]
MLCFNLWPVILWHGTFNFFTAGDQLNPAFPGFMSAMVIIVILWIARRYGQNLKSESTTAVAPFAIAQSKNLR